MCETPDKLETLIEKYADTILRLEYPNWINADSICEPAKTKGKKDRIASILQELCAEVGAIPEEDWMWWTEDLKNKNKNKMEGG